MWVCTRSSVWGFMMSLCVGEWIFDAKRSLASKSVCVCMSMSMCVCVCVCV